MTPRKAMESALKDAITQHLRPKGFTESLPHLRRRPDGQVCLISVQFFSAGGSFAVEVAECRPDGFTTSWGKHVPPQKMTAQDVPGASPTAGKLGLSQRRSLVRLRARNHEPDGEKVRSHEYYKVVADEVVRLLESQAEPFWEQQLSTRT